MRVKAFETPNISTEVMQEVIMTNMTLINKQVLWVLARFDKIGLIFLLDNPAIHFFLACYLSKNDWTAFSLLQFWKIQKSYKEHHLTYNKPGMSGLSMGSGRVTCFHQFGNPTLDTLQYGIRHNTLTQMFLLIFLKETSSFRLFIAGKVSSRVLVLCRLTSKDDLLKTLMTPSHC